MTVRLEAARQFVYANARVLERHRLTAMLDGDPAERVLEALLPYRNADGGFGHGLEPDVRGPGSQPSAALSALEALAEAGSQPEAIVTDTVDWIDSIAGPDGGVPSVLPSAVGFPRAPWMEPSEESGFLTYALTAQLHHLGVDHPWLDRGSAWCWKQLESADDIGGYTVKFALDFLDATPDRDRAAAVVERLREAVRADGTVPVPGGVEGEQLTATQLSPQPGAPSRALFTEQQIATNLDRIEAGQLDDGGWDFEFLHWSPGQSVEWRGIATLQALRTLKLNGRLSD